MKNISYKTVGLFAGVLLACFAFPEKSFALTHITDCQGLQDISLNLTEDYVLDNDIDCDSFDFTALGTYSGILDGAGFAIQNLVLDAVLTNTQGLFTVLDGANVKDLSITDADVTTNFEGGLLAGRATGAFIYDVHVTGQIQSTALASVTGGIVGRLESTNMYYSSADVDIVGFGIVGGLVGEAEDDSLIARSFAGGSVGGVENLGGLVGDLSDSYINNSYSTVAVTGTMDQVGGAIGRAEGESSAEKIYAVGAVSSPGNDFVGGLVGAVSAETEFSSSYWDTQTTGQASSAAGTGQTTVQMKTPSTFTDWDTANTWNIDPGNYPILLAYTADVPVLTEVEQLPGSVVDPGTLVYRFSANKFGIYTFEFCGVDSQTVDIDAGTVTLSGFEIGQTYTCDFYMQDLDGLNSNDLTIGPVSIRKRSSGSYIGRRNLPVDPEPAAETQPAAAAPAEPNPPPFALTRNLFYGLQGADVKWLQQFLNSHGFVLAESGAGSPGNETEFFGSLTQDAVSRYQQAKGITPTAGYVGPITRGFLNSWQ